MTAYPLPRLLDTAAAGPLRQELLARLALGQPIVLDGSEVERIGQAGLQVLASARAAAQAGGAGFAIVDPSATLTGMASLARLGAVLEPTA